MPDFGDDFGDAASREADGELEREVTVTLPIKYWMSALGAVQFSCDDAMARIREIREAGKTEDDLNASQRTALAAPLYIRASLVEMLVEEGILKREVRDRVGFPLLERLQQAYRDKS